MGLYDQIKIVCKNNGISINRLEQELGFPRSSISKFNTNKPSINKLQKIADHLGVTLDSLMTSTADGNMSFPCPDCGLWYDPEYPEDVIEHNQEHAAWKKATEKFGKLYCNSIENERIKAQNRNISHNLSLPLKERYSAQLEVLRCLFSRSVSANHYDLNHIPFKKYVSMMLGNKSYRSNIEDDLYEKLIKDYGALNGISSGTIYHIPEKHSQQMTIAAHFDGNDFTKEELDEIQRYADFVKSRRRSDKE